MDRSEDSPAVHHRWSHVSSEMTFKARPHVEAFAGEYFRLWLCKPHVLFPLVAVQIVGGGAVFIVLVVV